MSLIPEGFINNLLTRVDIVELISSRLSQPLRKTGSNYVGLCPFHDEKTASFSVSATKQLYYCFGCGAGGDAIKFVQELDKLTFVDAVEILAAQQGLELPLQNNKAEDRTVKESYALLEKAASFFESQLRKHPSAQQAVKYLKARGIQGTTAKSFRLGYAPPGWENLKRYILQNTTFTEDNLVQAGLLISKPNSSYDRFRKRIIFPICDRKGRICGFGGRVVDDDEPKYLNSPETVVFSKRRELYGLYEVRTRVRKPARLIVVEGYMDVLALFQANIPEVVATLGTSLTADHIKLLFQVVPEVTFCFDGDNAGRKAAWRALENCLPVIEPSWRVRFLFLPEGEDPDSYINRYGREAFLVATQKAISLADFFFSELSKQVDLEGIEDRSILAVKARELLQKLPDGIFKQMMFDRLARLVGLDCELLQVDGKQTKQVRPIVPEKMSYRRPPQSPKSPAITALALLVAYPNLIKLVHTNVEDYEVVTLPGAKLFCAVARILQLEPTMPLHKIKENLSVALATHFVPEELRGIAQFVPESGVEEEFLGALAKVQARYDEQILDVLLSKARVEELSSLEKVQLQQLLAEKGTKYFAE